MNDRDDILRAQLDEGIPLRDPAGRVVLRMGLLATLYLEDGHTARGREAVASCVDEFLAMCGEQLRWVQHPRSGAWLDLKKASLAAPRNWMVGAAFDENDQWEFYYHGGGTIEEASDLRVHGVGARKWESELTGQLSFITAVLPLTWFADHEGSFPAVVLAWCRRLRPLSGYGGLAILDSPHPAVAETYKQTAYGMARRFPGLEADHPVSHVHYLKNGIKGVNWVTVLGEKWISRLGGLPALRKELGEPFRLHEYPGGVLIQAGPRPQLGDVNRQIAIDEYRRLAQVLKPIRVTDHKSFPAWSGFDEQRTQAWLARFED